MSAILNEWGLQWILLGALGVSFIIAFHELGHYALARLLNMRVVRFSVGLGPKLVSFRRRLRRPKVVHQSAALGPHHRVLGGPRV